jgi:hypothetical protein
MKNTYWFSIHKGNKAQINFKSNVWYIVNFWKQIFSKASTLSLKVVELKSTHKF